MSSAYPYTRSEECSWQPEELARHLASLATSSRSADTASTHLLSHGWSSRQVPVLQKLYGTNDMTGNSNEPKGFFQSILVPILSALSSQLKEPLILMLLFSAAISLVLGNVADAVSIGIALFIVSFVAAIQEYRSERAIEKLANLVPHTCTVLRDGQIYDNFPASRLVVGDLVLLATGEYVNTSFWNLDDKYIFPFCFFIILGCNSPNLISLFECYFFPIDNNNFQSRPRRLQSRRFCGTLVG